MPDSETSMLDLVLRLPVHMVEGRRLGLATRLGQSPGPAAVVVAGMGGSGIGGRIAAGLLYGETAIPVLSWHDYELPVVASKGTLFIAVSHSGDTEETLAAYHQAARRRCRIVAITSGGELARVASRAGHPVVLIPGGMPPRAALGYLFGSLLAVLEQSGVCRSHERDVAEATSLILARCGCWHRQAGRLARTLAGRLPVIYSTSRLLDAVVDRWRFQFNENSKVMCHTHFLPEQNHNEIVGLGGPDFLSDRLVIIALVEPGTHPRTRLRLRHMLAIKRGTFERAVLVEAEGRSLLARAFSLVALGDLVSVELARRLGLDPMAIRPIVELKRRMARERS